MTAEMWKSTTLNFILKLTWIKTLGNGVTENNPSTPEKQIRGTALSVLKPQRQDCARATDPESKVSQPA